MYYVVSRLSIEQGGRMGELWMERRGKEVTVSERATEVGICKKYYWVKAGSLEGCKPGLW